MSLRRMFLNSGGNVLQSFKSFVSSDGGTITNEDYLKTRLAHAEENGYFENIKLWYASEFGIKSNAGFASKIYDVIDPKNNSISNAVGSEQPAFNAIAQNSKSAIISDGIDDALYTSHTNEILADEREHLIILALKPLAHSSDTNRYLFGSKDNVASPGIGIRQQTAPVYTWQNIIVNSIPGSIITINPNVAGSPNDAWYVMAFNSRDLGTWRQNDLIGSIRTAIRNDSALNGFTLFGNYRSSTPTAQLTRYEFAEFMLIDAKVGYSLLNDIMEQINTHYNIYTPVTYTNYPIDSLSNIDGAFSLRKIKSTYSGNCIRLRRSSDDAEMDFGFSGDYIDIAAINTWAGGDNLFVRTWYDQEGGANHWQQSTNGLQFQFFTTGGGDGGDLAYLKGISANGTYMLRTTGLTSSSLCRVYTVLDSPSTFVNIWSGGGSAARFGVSTRTNSATLGCYKRIGATSYTAQLTSNGFGNNTVIVNTFSNNAATPSSSDLTPENQTSAEQNTSLITADNSKGGDGTITLGNSSNEHPFNGKLYEWIAIGNISHNRRNIQHSAINFYQNLS